MGLAIGIFVIAAGWALAFALCMGNMARNLNRIWPIADQYPTLKKILTALLWLLAAGGVIVVALCVWAVWSCFQAGSDIFG